MIELEPLENLRPPINERDLLTEFDQSMLFDAKDMVDLVNELRDMAMSQANYGEDGEVEPSSTWPNGSGDHFHTWESDEAMLGDNWSKYSGKGFDTHYTHNAGSTTQEEYDDAKKSAQAGKYHPTGTNSSDSSDDGDGGGGLLGKILDWFTGGGGDDANEITPESEAGKGMGRIYSSVYDLVPETLVSNHIEAMDVIAHQMPMFIGVQQATTHLF